MVGVRLAYPALEIVTDALEASKSDDGNHDDPSRRLFVERLEELKRHMDFVNSIFLSFVGSDAAAAGDISSVDEIKESASR